MVDSLTLAARCAALQASVAVLDETPSDALCKLIDELSAIASDVATKEEALRVHEAALQEREARIDTKLELLAELKAENHRRQPDADDSIDHLPTPAKTITLNVGGTLFTTARETLLRIPGEYFLDLDPSTFPRIMKLLRTGFLPMDGLSEADEAELREMLDYLQIECPQPTPSAPPLRERDTIVRQTTTGWSNVLATTRERSFAVRVRLGAKIEVGFTTLKSFSPQIHRYTSAARGYFFNCETYDVYSQLTKRVPSGLDPSTPAGSVVLLVRHDRDRSCIQFRINGTALAMMLRVEAGDDGALFPIARISSTGAEVELLPFEDPLRGKAVDDASGHLRTSLVADCTAPPLRIDGIDGVVTWPLSPAHAAALAALDVNRGMVLPTAFSFAQPEQWRQAVKNVLRGQVAQVIIDADLVLSHLVVDSVGSSAALMPNEMPPDSFGYMILHLPSSYDGGDMAFTYSYATEKWTPDTTGMAMVTTFRDLVAASAPITHGVRMALVFRLVGQDEDEDMCPMPYNQEDGIDAFHQVAQRPLHTHHRIAYYDVDDPPCALDTPWTFETLGTYEAGLVHALLTTELFDVALVTFALESDDDVAFEKQLRRSHYVEYSDDDDDDDDDAYERKFKNQVATCTPHVACNVPAEVVAKVVGSGVDAFLFDNTPIDHHSFEAPPFALVFWLKRYRACILGLDVVFPLVQNAITNHAMDQPLLGLPSGRDALHGALGVFRRDDLVGFGEKSGLTTMCDILLALDDFELVVVFLRDAIFVRYDMPLRETAASIHACLARYGWSRLAPAMHGLLSRWHRTPAFRAPSWEYMDCDITPRLLTSLAGITTDAVCPPLDQPFVCEFIKGCYDHALRRPRFRPDSDMDPEDFRRFAANIVLLDWYLDEHVPHSVHGNYLSAFLPPSMLLAVDAFLYMRQPRSSTLLAVMKKLPPAKVLLYVPEALAVALKSQPTMVVDPYVHVIEIAFALFDAASVRYKPVGATIFASLVAVLERAGRCDATAFEKCWTHLFPASLAGTRQRLQERTSPLPDDLRTCIAALVAALAPTLSSEKDWQPTYTGCYKSWVQPGLLAVEVLATVDPAQVPALLHDWFEALDRDAPVADADDTFRRTLLFAPRTRYFVCGARDPTRELYYPLATLLEKVVPQHVVEIEHVVQRCFAVLGRVRTRAPRPDITDYVFNDIALDAAHCDMCARLAAFLTDGTQTRLHLPFGKSVCDRGRQCINANQHRLELAVGRRGSNDCVIKLQQHGGVDEDQLAAHVKAQQVDADDRARIAALDVILADALRRKAQNNSTNDDDDDDDKAVHHDRVKRPRRTTD
ncbi:hypothetical protein SPRG_12489 [Saprolegnia parasitica CBS 223.65]|uniref:BTB domain-containing protein n=1 Tax=Saprolegnia parasitica (strain CBS 223.65) TaxID=695850 RepID=A0A067BXD7_SAPPC|nr:hypothetical protein SPRG_12489 [Saprolegnia parasitica CBS 223.65]KDO21525.1 hypothetical protein SPRG_12489 [Saprolegnia parasitica CBS 223.65]|eukprot:XP_012207792.1 hypothetical protein SPRG_12489 [Saprolegnia parasitica CBS 223.65]